MSKISFDKKRRDSGEEKMKKSPTLKFSIIAGLIMVAAVTVYMIIKLKGSEFGNYFIVPGVIIAAIIIIVYLFQYRNLFRKE